MLRMPTGMKDTSSGVLTDSLTVPFGSTLPNGFAPITLQRPYITGAAVGIRRRQPRT